MRLGDGRQRDEAAPGTPDVRELALRVARVSMLSVEPDIRLAGVRVVLKVESQIQADQKAEIESWRIGGPPQCMQRRVLGGYVTSQ